MFLRVITPDTEQIRVTSIIGVLKNALFKSAAQPRRFTLHLQDGAGNSGSADFTLILNRNLKSGMMWKDFLDRYVESGDLSEDEATAFGRDLFQALIAETGMGKVWHAIHASAQGRPVRMTAELGAYTEPVSGLPLELLHDGVQFVFAKPGSGLQRSLLQTPVKPFHIPDAPRVLFAWACPPMSGDMFDPAPHRETLHRIFGDRMNVIEQAGIEQISSALDQACHAGIPFHYLHLLAHGYRDAVTGGICLASSSGMAEYIPPQRLGDAIRGRNLRLAFLCSCKTAAAGDMAFSDAAQQLMAVSGGDLPCVAATQANLPVRGSADMSGRFYRLLGETRDPVIALSNARKDAYTGKTGAWTAWSAPVIYTRPDLPVSARRKVVSRGLPARRSTYISRELESDILNTLKQNRFAALVGLPGIGKTETGRETARRALDASLCTRVIYQEILPGYTVSQLRSLLGTALDQTSVENDEFLAALFASQTDHILLALDNAEDLMRDPDSENRFRDMLNTLLAHCPDLKILMTTRWLMSGITPAPRQFAVPPMTAEQTSQLLASELQERAHGNRNGNIPNPGKN